MAAYQFIMIVVCLFVFGALYAAVSDPVETIRYEFAGVGNENDNFLDMAFFIFSAVTPMAVLTMLGIYGFATTQKRG